MLLLDEAPCNIIACILTSSCAWSKRPCSETLIWKGVGKTAWSLALSHMHNRNTQRECTSSTMAQYLCLTLRWRPVPTGGGCSSASVASCRHHRRVFLLVSANRDTTLSQISEDHPWTYSDHPWITKNKCKHMQFCKLNLHICIELSSFLLQIELLHPCYNGPGKVEDLPHYHLWVF